MIKSQIKDALLHELDENNIITGNQIEDVEDKFNHIKDIKEIIEEILDEDFTFIPTPIPNEYDTSIIYILR